MSVGNSGYAVIGAGGCDAHPTIENVCPDCAGAGAADFDIVGADNEHSTESEACERCEGAGIVESAGVALMALYFIDYCQARNLRALAECEQEKAAIRRLADFCGDADDMRLAASIYSRVGETANASHLLREISGEVA